jgi:hypothetical protein
MTRRHVLLPAIVCLALGVLAPTASAKTVFHPRVRGALGLSPTVNSKGQFGTQDIASGLQIPVTYHGGSVMAGGVTVHTIFWAPAGYAFQGSPQSGVATYEAMVQQFFTDVAHDSGATTNVFSVEHQFAEGTAPGGITPGDYSISYDATNANDSINDTDAYPSKADQCASPDNASTCVTDAQLQAEVDHIATTHGNQRGLHNLWYVFLPPDVDECILPGVCGTNAFGGYHSLSNLGHGLTIYALTIDPIIEAGSISPGADPEGNPDAEVTVDIAAHETNEAMSDPEGVGYMDPNGFEIGDKCEFGPQRGTPLGFAGPDHAPYNQVINGHKYLIQEMWANHDNNGNPNCVQRTTNTHNDLPLPQVNLTQFSSTVSGNTEKGAGGTAVTVSLIRNGPGGTASNPNPVTVASGTTTSASDGSWTVSLAPHAVGDDRDEIDIDYSGANAPSPSHVVILTGNGGNPFTESGWTGWSDLDNGSFLTNNPALGGPSLTLGPCFQNGVFSATKDGSSLTPGGSPTDFCNTQTDTTTVGTGGVEPSDVVTQGSNDNRAFQDPNLPTANPTGGLVNLSVPVGEADAVSTFPTSLATFVPVGAPSGFPTCSADLQAQSVTCSGLVPSENYSVTDSRTGKSQSAAADNSGDITVAFATGTVQGGDAMALSNGSRMLTTLHVAHLRVDITGEQTVLSGGTCQPDQYYAPPLSAEPTNAGAGDPTAIAGGSALTDSICPSNGDATGLSATNIVQTDELSGGQTSTQVPDVENTSPMEGETVYGNFVAVAESGLPGPNNSVMPTDSTSKIAVSIAPAGGGAPVFTSPNVDTSTGTPVPALSPGSYKGTWTLSDANGDTRTVTTRFIEESALQGPPGPRGPRGPRGKRGPKPKVSCKLVHHGTKIKCRVTFPKHRKTKGRLQMRIARGGHVAALGNGRVSHGSATVTLRELRHLTRGAWTVTIVLSQAHQAATTTRMKLRVT